MRHKFWTSTISLLVFSSEQSHGSWPIGFTNAIGVNNYEQ